MRKKQDDIPFYKKQTRLVLKHCGHIDATSIKEYIAVGGYTAFEKALFDMSPEGIVKTISDSNLRGRGGGGFPTRSQGRNPPSSTSYVTATRATRARSWIAP